MQYNTVYSFDKTENNLTQIITAEQYSDLLKIQEFPVIAKGAGLSYCNAAGAKNAKSIDMRSLDRVLNFDQQNGRISIEAGASIGYLNNITAPHGWILPVLPGYPAITVGGCVAFNVHGKAQYKTGTFLNWIDELVVYHPAYGEIKCSANERPDLFNLTIGGMGLTGIILSVTLRLRKIKGSMLEQKAMRAANIAEAVSIMQNCMEEWDYSYSWNNFNLTGSSFGKGIVYLEKHLDKGGPERQFAYKNRLESTRNGPGLLGSATVKLMCAMYYFMEGLKPSSRCLRLAHATFPIYGREIYYNLYGKKGFREYQMLFPANTWQAAAEELRNLVAAMSMPVSLGSLKIFRGQQHYLSFSGSGVCITLDVPNNDKSIGFFSAIDEITIKFGGIINLSKDSRASGELVSRLFPQYSIFKEQLNAFDPKKLFVSDLRNRLYL